MSNNRKPGDWDCTSCGHLNFSRRDCCQRCYAPRSADSFSGSSVKPGDWYCCSCGTHNYASRTQCHKCQVHKAQAAIGVYTAGGDNAGHDGTEWKYGDWLCTRSGCNKHNFASRKECFQCNMPRAYCNSSGYQ